VIRGRAGGTGRVRCQLVVIDGPDRGRACRLAAGAATIGTDAACELALSDDRVSAKHLSIEAVESRFVVRDLGSTNGTWYEGSRITEVTVPAGSFTAVVQTEDWNPLDPDVVEHKFYAPGVGKIRERKVAGGDGYVELIDYSIA